MLSNFLKLCFFLALWSLVLSWLHNNCRSHFQQQRNVINTRLYSKRPKLHAKGHQPVTVTNSEIWKQDRQPNFNIQDTFAVLGSSENVRFAVPDVEVDGGSPYFALAYCWSLQQRLKNTPLEINDARLVESIHLRGAVKHFLSNGMIPSVAYLEHKSKALHDIQPSLAVSIDADKEILHTLSCYFRSTIRVYELRNKSPGNHQKVLVPRITFGSPEFDKGPQFHVLRTNLYMRSRVHPKGQEGNVVFDRYWPIVPVPPEPSAPKLHHEDTTTKEDDMLLAARKRLSTNLVAKKAAAVALQEAKEMVCAWIKSIWKSITGWSHKQD